MNNELIMSNTDTDLHRAVENGNTEAADFFFPPENIIFTEDQLSFDNLPLWPFSIKSQHCVSASKNFRSFSAESSRWSLDRAQKIKVIIIKAKLQLFTIFTFTA